MSVAFLMPPEQTKVEMEDAEVGVTSKTFRKGHTAMTVAVIGAVCAGLASIIVPISQSYFSRPPAAKSNLLEVVQALKDTSEQQAKEIRQMHDDMVEQRSWFKGYLAAQGIDVRDPPNTPSASTPVVEITKPVSRRPGGSLSGFGSGQVLVGTPLPSPKPLSKSKEIPVPFVPTPQQ